MKILVVSPYKHKIGLASFYFNAFKEIGIETEFFALRDQATWESYFEKIVSHLSARILSIKKIIYKQSFTNLLNRINKFNPDLIFVVQGDDLATEVLKEVKKNFKSKIFLYYSDNPWISTARFHSYLWNNLPLFDCVFIFTKHLIPHLYFRGANKVEYLPFGFDPSIHKEKSAPSELVSLFTSPVSYVGTWNPYIESWLKELIPFGLKIWGNSWERSDTDIYNIWKASGKTGHGQGEEVSFVAAHSDIIVNFIRSEHQAGQSMKTFELPACGGFVLSTRTDEQISFFKEKIHMDYFFTLEELKNKLRYYLSNKEDVIEIKKNMKEIIQNHTYLNRAKTIIDLIKI